MYAYGKLGAAALTFGVVVSATREGFAQRAHPQGLVVQSDVLGLPLVSYNFETRKTIGVGDVAGLYEFVGVHYYVLDTFRVGVSLQFAEALSEPLPGQSRFTSFAVTPQVGWNFWGPLFVSAGFSVLPWTQGGRPAPPSTATNNHFDLGVWLIAGASFRLVDRVNLLLAGGAPYTFLDHRAIAFTPLVGVGIPLN